MKGLEVWLICFNQRGCLLQPSTRKELWWNSLRTKLSIQGLVHCSVVNECNLCSRRMFNLTVSVESLVYQWIVDLRLFNTCLRIWWGLLDLIWAWFIFYLIKSNNSKARIKYCIKKLMRRDHAGPFLKINVVHACMHACMHESIHGIGFAAG